MKRRVGQREGSSRKPPAKESYVGWLLEDFDSQGLRVVYPLLRGSGEASGVEIPKERGNTTQFPGPTPDEIGENYRKMTNLYFREHFSPSSGEFWGQFSSCSGSGREGNFVLFFPIFQGFPPRRLTRPSKWENNSQLKGDSLATPAGTERSQIPQIGPKWLRESFRKVVGTSGAEVQKKSPAALHWRERGLHRCEQGLHRRERLYLNFRTIAPSDL